MNRSRLYFFLLSLACLVPVITAGLTRAATDRGAEDSLSRQLSVFSEVLSLIRRAYVDETDVEELLTGALDGTTDALGPLSTWVPPDQVETFLAVRGVGAGRSGLSVGKERGICFVIAVMAGSPGSAAGIERGDLIAKIDGVTTRTLPLWRVQQLLAGPPRTTLELELLHRGQSRAATLTLEEFRVPEAAVTEVRGIPVLRLQQLRAAEVESVRGLLDGIAAAGQQRLVIDLRGVAGGEMEAAYALAEQFVSGRLGMLSGGEGAEVSFQGMAEPVWAGRLAVLVDGGTQGAAEILAAVLQQSGGAQLVGQRSFGHAGRQALVPLSNGSRLLITDAFYTGPDGRPIDSSLIPDVAVDGLSRRFADQETPLDDFILERGLELLLTDEPAPEKKVA